MNVGDDWLAGLRRRADCAPSQPRVPLHIAGAACGSIEVALARRMHEAGLLVGDAVGWSLHGQVDQALERAARWLHEHGHAGRWRDERLAVVDGQGRQHGLVERAAARPLGITTLAVHLVAATAEGHVWVQQRALDKAVDPGLLDTLVGGLAAGGESAEETLARESWEEAGLRRSDMASLAMMGTLLVRRPLPEGYMVERLVIYEALLRAAFTPTNQDGEVMAFHRISPQELLEGIRQERYTLEASLIHAQWLQGRGLL